MKKLVMTVVVLASAASIATAQTVTSENVVGYTKVEAIGGQLSLVAVNFETDGAALNALVGDQLDDLSSIFVWDKDGGVYLPVASKTRGTWSPDHVINMGDALWLSPSGSATQDVLFAGEVLISGTNSYTVAPGIDATGFYYPTEVTFKDTDLAATVPDLSTLFVWTGSAYHQWNKTRGSWAPVAPATGDAVLGPSQAYWIKSASSTNKTVNEIRPFDL